MMQKAWKSIGIWLGLNIALILLINWFVLDMDRVEQAYSRGFYPLYQYLPKFLFGLVPFNLGDLLYAAFIGFMLFLLFRIIKLLFQRFYKKSLFTLAILVGFILSLYVFFHVAWGINYYRVPVSKQMELNLDTILQEDHLRILDQHILVANELRDRLDLSHIDQAAVDREIEAMMRADATFPMLSKTQVKVKYPLSSTLIAYFGTSGYLNPFSNESQVNALIPRSSYPFTAAHELAHQMGIGFEDECNFIAYVKLKDHPKAWYSYAAYYESLQYLLRSLYWVDQGLFEAYKKKLSVKVRQDLEADRRFWESYTGWLTDLSGLFYDQYLKHNNQKEGMARYGMVSRLIIAYEKKAGY